MKINRMNKYTIQRLNTDEAAGVTRCMIKTYGLDYPSHEVYEPQKIAYLNSAGEMISVVAKTPKGEVVGHYCIIIENKESKLGELGQAAVIPAHRGRGLMKKMRAKLESIAAGLNLAGLYSAPVTSHTFSQKVNLDFGSRECCIDLGYVPQGVNFAPQDAKRGNKDKIVNAYVKGKIKAPSFITSGGDNIPQRETIVVFFKYLAAPKSAAVYPPKRHAQMIRRIYDNLGVKRRFSKKQKASPAERTVFDYKISPQWTCSWIGFFDYGNDFDAILRSLLNVIFAQNVETVHIDLPLSSPLTPKHCSILESMGYIFIGIIPSFLNGADALRLQYTTKKINFSQINVYSGFAKKLLAYIEQEYNKKKPGVRH